jgi:cytochrome c peroxidase
VLWACLWAPLACLAQDVPSAAAPAAALADVGRKLFFDTSLSASGKLACGTCHDPRYAYGPPPGKAIAFGGPGMNRSGTRAVPSLRYLRGVPGFALGHRFADGDLGPIGGYTWDGRAGSIQAQARLPLLAANEMANASPAAFVQRLRKARYAGEFRSLFGAAVFGDPERALDAAVRALEAFQATPAEFYPYSSRYDAFLRGELDLSEREERGVAIFKDPNKGNCASCHLVVSRAGVPPAFTDYDFANVGVPRNRNLPANADPTFYDLGLCGPERADLRDRQEYCGFFRAPTLRNVAIRDAFFHNGVFHDLRQVLEFYVERDLAPEKYYPRRADGSVRKYDDLPPGMPDNIDRDAPLNRAPGTTAALTADEIDELIAFLETLTDRDALAAAPTDRADTTDRARVLKSPDEYAWRLFAALNAPAAAGATPILRGEILRGENRHSAESADPPVVWETWRNASDVYLEDGRDPGPWGSVGAGRRAGRPLADETRFETPPNAALPHARHVVAGRMQDVEDPFAAAARLTEIRMNRRAFEYIRARELYDVEGQMRAIAMPAGVHFPMGSIEVKAKWRAIRPEERNRYRSLTVRMRDGTQRLYGLTALHIASKDLPNWFWATFEHADNARLPDGEGWQLPSVDRFACEARECNRAPRGLGLEGTVWENYRLRGTLTRPVDAQGRALLLANSEFEAGFQRSSSCITCHARAALAIDSGAAIRLPIFATGEPSSADASAPARRGFVGAPQSAWFEERDAGGASRRIYQRLDYVWSLAKARPKNRS